LRMFSRIFTTEQDPGLPGGITRLCKKSCVCAQLKRVTDRQTDGRKSDLSNGTLTT